LRSDPDRLSSLRRFRCAGVSSVFDLGGCVPPAGGTAPVAVLLPTIGLVATPACVLVVAPGRAGVVVASGAGVIAAVVGAGAAAAVVTVLVIAGGGGPVSPASFTSAAASTPRDNATAAATAATGAFQLGEAASLVRAAAPQRRHHSWVG
jgi:hypothetical protein